MAQFRDWAGEDGKNENVSLKPVLLTTSLPSVGQELKAVLKFRYHKLTLYEYKIKGKLVNGKLVKRKLVKENLSKDYWRGGKLVKRKFVNRKTGQR